MQNNENGGLARHWIQGLCKGCVVRQGGEEMGEGMAGWPLPRAPRATLYL